jgi:Fur family ferric uptake transcriptional regulator
VPANSATQNQPWEEFSLNHETRERRSVSSRRAQKAVSMRSTKRSAEHHSLRARIRAFGLRCTAARLAVLAELQRATSPLSHADIARALAPLNLDRASVYRILMELSEAGLVSRLDLGDHVWCFELRENGPGKASEHAHFLCMECGAVLCLDGVEIKVGTSSRNRRSTFGNVTEVLLKGRCARCS